MKHRRKKLIIQIMLIIIPLFAILAVVNIWIMEKSTVNAFLDSQKSHTELYINRLKSSIDLYVPKELELFWNILEEKPLDTRVVPNSDESDEYDRIIYGNINDASDYDKSTENLLKAPDYIQMIGARHWRNTLESIIESVCANGSDEICQMFVMDITDPYVGMVIADYRKEGGSKQIGDYFDLELSEHPALEQILETGSEESVYEKSNDFPYKGNYYIAYRPIQIEGKVRGVIGLAYRWDAFKEQMSEIKVKAIIVIIIGCLLAMLLLYFGLRKLAVRPVTKIENALIQYTEDKDSKKIVKNMYDIKVKNEIGYLADVVSDLALEIDLHTKENVRLATEQARTEKELYEAEVQIMVSQIRPHFMYNTLSSIAMLCKLDPDTAYEATINFSDYLRCNMDSLKQTAPVPFTKELEHLKKYLYIEKLRFQDLLNIEYDIQTTDFFLPLLSIQPLVENAVKHGVGMKEDGGTVTIATRETEDAYEVIISDDGVGFDVNEKKDDGRSHVGMENTKKRLRDMCNADIIITSKVGEGTTARVIIPKNRKENMET